jgi:hypothetical protein
MSVQNLKIYCQCWEFNHSISLTDRSIFNKTAQKWKVGDEIDLMDYAMNVSSLRYSTSRNEANGNYNSLINTAADMTLKLSGIKDDSFLINYFGFYDTTGVVAFRQYIITILYDNIPVFSGYLNQDSLFSNYDTSANSDIIDVQILSIKKEFVRYFDTADLDVNNEARIKNYQDIFYDGFQCPWRLWSGYDEDKDYQFAVRPSTLIQKMTGLDSVISSPSIENIGGDPMLSWYVNNIPAFFKDNNSNNWWIKSGYKRFWQKTVSTYYFIDKLCTSMGWSWDLKNEGYSGNYGLTLANNSEFNGTVIEIDYSKLIDMRVGFTLKSDLDYIIIPCGYVNAPRYHTQGIPVKILSTKNTFVNNSQFFGYFEGTPNGYQLYKGDPPAVYVYENAQKPSEYDIREFWYDAEGGNWGDGLNQRDLQIVSNKILLLDGGNHDEHCTVINTSLGWQQNTCDISSLGTDYGILFRGSVGDCCFKASLSNQSQLIQDYNSYSQTTDFKNNFISLLGGNTQTIEGWINEVIFEPQAAIQFINTENDFYKNYKFAINELEVDMVNERTKIVAVRQE